MCGFSNQLFTSTAFDLHKVKVLFLIAGSLTTKLRSEIFLWNRIWDLAGLLILDLLNKIGYFCPLFSTTWLKYLQSHFFRATHTNMYIEKVLVGYIRIRDYFSAYIRNLKSLVLPKLFSLNWLNDIWYWPRLPKNALNSLQNANKFSLL